MRMRVVVHCWLGIAAVLASGCELPPKMLPPAPGAPSPQVTAGPTKDAETPADAERFGADDLLEPRVWFPAHGARAESIDEYDNSYGCVSIVVGAAHEPALQCTDIEDVSTGGDENSVFRVITHQIVRVVREGKVVKVLDVRTRLEPLDGVAATLGQEQPSGIVDMKLTIAADGLSAIVEPLDPKTDCRRRGATHVVDDDPEIAAQLQVWVAFDDEWTTRICKARGRYFWKNRFFRR